eukprot:g27840.t2
MVHAVSTIGERQFIHRTRTIKQLTCPQWSEAFYSPLPEDFDTARLQISVYGATAANLVTKATSFIGGEVAKVARADPMLEGSNHEDDWFIGRAHVDLTTAVSGALIAEELRTTTQDRVTTGFRIQPGVAFEVMCERRLRPSFNEHSGEGVKMIPRRHHQLTRTSDPIQQSLPIIDNGQQSMLSVEDLELEKAAQELQARSLPILKTKFHDSPELYKLNVIDKAAQARFSRRTEHRTSDITRSLREKPMFNRLHWHQPAELPVNLPPVAHGNDFSATLEASAAVGFEEFMSSVDAIVMGRKTFETVRDMEDAPWPYGDLPVTVLTEKGVVVPERLRGSSSARFP